MSNPFASLSTAQLVAAHIAVSAMGSEIKARHEAAMKEELAAAQIEDKLRVLYYEVQKRMQDEGTASIDTVAGKATLKTSVEYNVQDLEKWADYVVESRDLSFFSKSLSKPAVDAYRKQHGDELPPGLKAFTRQHVQFKAKK